METIAWFIFLVIIQTVLIYFKKKKDWSVSWGIVLIPAYVLLATGLVVLAVALIFYNVFG